MKHLARLLGRLVYEKRQYKFYGYQPGQGDGRTDPHIRVYETWGDIPIRFRKIAAAAPWRNVMYYRMKRGGARLMCYSEDGERLDAFGWIQDWRPFRRRFGAIAREGTMVGFYWTAPESRGRGYFSRLLAHGLALSDKKRPIIVCVGTENVASWRGVEKAGFASLGEWEGRVWFRCFSRMRRISDGLR